MKKIVIFLSVLFLSILLSGCISIPLGDGGKLEVSKDGVNVDVGEEEEDGKEIEDSTEIDTGLEDEEDATDDEEEEDKSQELETDSNSCSEEIEDPRGNERALKQLAELAPPNFPMPDCTKMESVKEDYYDAYKAVTVESYFVVEGYWADIYDVYKEYLEESGFGPLEMKENAKEKSAWITGKTPDYDATMYFNQIDREDDVELVKIRVIFYHYDTPRDE